MSARRWEQRTEQCGIRAGVNLVGFEREAACVCVRASVCVGGLYAQLRSVSLWNNMCITYSDVFKIYCWFCDLQCAMGIINDIDQ